MRKKIAIAAAFLATFVIGLVSVSLATTPQVSAPTQVHVIEHAKTDKVIETGRSGDSSGDLLTFHNPVFDATDSRWVGHDQGDCIRIAPRAGSWECRWVTILNGGSITVEGPFYDSHDSVLVITGGRGKYKDAQGSMELKVLLDGTGYDFIFHVLSS
jgi:allene oxide cyclase